MLNHTFTQQDSILYLTELCIVVSSSLHCVPEDYQQLIEDIVRDGRLYASENHQEILKVLMDTMQLQTYNYMVL